MDLSDLFYYSRNTGSLLQIIVAIIASLTYKKYNTGFFKYFLAILWFVVLIDVSAKFCDRKNYNYVTIIYNLYHLINFSFLLILYRATIKKITHRKWIIIFLIGYIITFFCNLFFQNYQYEIQTIPFIIGGIFIIISIVFYFSELLNSNEILYTSKNLLFWISIGLLLYFVGKIPIRIVRNHWEEFNNYEIILIVDVSLGILMNLFFITGFICSEKNKQY